MKSEARRGTYALVVGRCTKNTTTTCWQDLIIDVGMAAESLREFQ